MRTKHAFKPSSLDRLENRDVPSTVVIPSGPGGHNVFGGPTGFTGQFTGFGTVKTSSGGVAAAPAAVSNGIVNSGLRQNAFSVPTGPVGGFNNFATAFTAGGLGTTPTGINQFGGPIGFTNQFTGFSNVRTSGRGALGSNNVMTFNQGMTGGTFANNNFGFSSGLITNRNLGTANVSGFSPLGSFAARNAFLLPRR